MLMIKTSEEAIQKLDLLKSQIRHIKYNHDIHKIILNLNGLIKTLSQKEVFARQTKKHYVLDEPLHELNQAFDYIEKLIIIATLCD